MGNPYLFLWKATISTFFLIFFIKANIAVAQTEKIIFSKGLSNTDRDIFSINPDGTGLVALIQWTGSDEIYARISPDGTKLAFASNLINNH